MHVFEKEQVNERAKQPTNDLLFSPLTESKHTPAEHKSENV